MNQKGFWEEIVLLGVGLLVLYLMLAIASPILDLLFPLLDNTDIYPMGWLVKLFIQLLPLIVIILLFVRIKRTSERSGSGF